MKLTRNRSKFFAGLLIFLLLMFICGCSTNDSQGLENTPPSSQDDSTLYGNNRNIFVSENDEYVYVSDTTKIFGISKVDGSTTEIFSADTNQYNAIPVFEAFGNRVYIITMDGVLHSVARDGFDPQTINLPETITIDNNTIVNGYTYDNGLYLVFGFSGTDSVWQISDDPLTLNEASIDITSKTVLDDGSVFSIETDPNNFTTHLYRVDQDNKIEITGPDEAIMTNLIDYDADYVYYGADDVKTMQFNIYKVALDGSNKTILASVPEYRMVYFDQKNVYLDTNDGVLIFDKSSGQQTGTYQLENATFEIIDGKAVYYMDGFYVDISTGEKVQFQ